MSGSQIVNIYGYLQMSCYVQHKKNFIHHHPQPFHHPFAAVEEFCNAVTSSLVLFETLGFLDAATTGGEAGAAGEDTGSSNR